MEQVNSGEPCVPPPAITVEPALGLLRSCQSWRMVHMSLLLPCRRVDLFDEPRQVGADVLERLVFGQIDRFDLEGLDEALRFGVVAGVATSAHRPDEPVLGEECPSNRNNSGKQLSHGPILAELSTKIELGASNTVAPPAGRPASTGEDSPGAP